MFHDMTDDLDWLLKATWGAKSQCLLSGIWTGPAQFKKKTWLKSVALHTQAIVPHWQLKFSGRAQFSAGLLHATKEVKNTWKFKIRRPHSLFSKHFLLKYFNTFFYSTLIVSISATLTD